MEKPLTKRNVQFLAKNERISEKFWTIWSLTNGLEKSERGKPYLKCA